MEQKQQTAIYVSVFVFMLYKCIDLAGWAARSLQICRQLCIIFVIVLCVCLSRGYTLHSQRKQSKQPQTHRNRK